VQHVILIVPEIIPDCHLLYEKLSFSSVSVPVSIWYSVSHTATYNRSVTTDHELNIMTFQCHSEKTDQFFTISLSTENDSVITQ